jgi:hypothetical protein
MQAATTEAMQLWFVAKAAVALSPILVFLTADVMGRLVAPRSERETTRREPAGVAARRG